MEDHGLFGPESVTWRVMGEPILLVGGFRALLMQSLHPRAMRGVMQNSAFMDPDEAWARFVRTSEFVRVRTYGTTDEVERAARRVRKLHAKLSAVDPDTGERFRLDEPASLLWVHIGEVDSYLTVARRAGVRLSDTDADAFVAESRRSAALVGLDPQAVPGSVAELNACIETYRPGLRLVPEAAHPLRSSLRTPLPGLLATLRPVVPALTLARLRHPAALGQKAVRAAGHARRRPVGHRHAARPAHRARPGARGRPLQPRRPPRPQADGRLSRRSPPVARTNRRMAH